MNHEAANALDEAMALMLADLNSTNILNCARKARLLANLLAVEHHGSHRLVEGLAGDLSRLCKSVLVLERDPEVIRRNTLAMVLMSLSPLTVGIQDLLSSPDFPLWKIGMEGLVLGLEVMGTTQYLEAAKLIAGTEYECNLWELEGRSMELIAGRSDAARLPAQQQSISGFFDSLKGDNYRHEQRPAVFFVLALLLSIISYSMVRNALKT
jgi:hypothetical protein